MQYAEERGAGAAIGDVRGQEHDVARHELEPRLVAEAIMSPTEPITRSFRSPPGTGVAKVPRPA